jgi:hypothetical protein
MPEPNLFKIFTAPLNKIGIRYMVTGAVAAIIYGEPRLTHDIDLVIELKLDEVKKIQEGFPSEEFYCPPEEAIKLEIKRPSRGHFNIIHRETGFKADCYLLGDDKLHLWGISRRKELDIEGEPVWVASPEYVIVRKLEYFREGRSEKHLKDIASILAISPDQINFGQLQEKINAYGLEKEWTAAKSTLEK